MPTDPQITLGMRLRNAREKCRLTQQQVADVTGIALRSITGIEAGEANPSFHALYTLVQLYGISADPLFRDEVPPALQAEADTKRLLGCYNACNSSGRKLLVGIAEQLASELRDAASAEDLMG